MQKVMTALFLTWSLSSISQLSVTETLPISQSLDADQNTGITIYFSDLVNGFTFTPETFQVFGRWSGPMPGTFTISGVGNAMYFDPVRPFLAGEWITVSLSEGIQSISGDSLLNGFQYNFWIKTEPGQLQLSEPQIIEMREFGEGWIQCYGAYAGDINDDEMSDLAVINEISEDVRILLNNETNGFTDFSIEPIPGSDRPSINEGADFNRDGFIDLAIGSTQSHTVTILYGNGTGFENETSLTADVAVRGLAVLDFNGDGLMDIATANRNGSNIALIENLGEEFSQATLIDLPCNGETAMAAGDFNEDGLLDLVVGCHFSGDVSIVLNNYGVFELSDSELVNSQPWMLAIGDVNDDGHLDVATANSGSATLSILMGDGLGGLSSPQYYSTGNFPLAIDLGDLDGDGDLDVISSNYQSANFTLYENDGSGTFINPIEYQAQQAGSCAIFHDNNSDGILDLTLVDELVDELYIFTNQAPVGINELDRPHVQFYPNPSNGSVQFEGIMNNEYLQIFNLQGKLIKTVCENGRIDFTELSSGAYLVKSNLQGFVDEIIIE